MKDAACNRAHEPERAREYACVWRMCECVRVCVSVCKSGSKIGQRSSNKGLKFCYLSLSLSPSLSPSLSLSLTLSLPLHRNHTHSSPLCATTVSQPILCSTVLPGLAPSLSPVLLLLTRWLLFLLLSPSPLLTRTPRGRGWGGRPGGNGAVRRPTGHPRRLRVRSEKRKEKRESVSLCVCVYCVPVYPVCVCVRLCLCVLCISLCVHVCVCVMG